MRLMTAAFSSPPTRSVLFSRTMSAKASCSTDCSQGRHTMNRVLSRQSKPVMHAYKQVKYGQQDNVWRPLSSALDTRDNGLIFLRV